MGNWRISKLQGNYEGLFRNDNGQDDANITTLFDFVKSSSLGDQFTPGVLPTDRRHVVNVYANYTFNDGINVGTGWRYQTGYPLSKLGAHPAYLNQGEIAIGGRGSQGRSLATTASTRTWITPGRYPNGTASLADHSTPLMRAAWTSRSGLNLSAFASGSCVNNQNQN